MKNDAGLGWRVYRFDRVIQLNLQSTSNRLPEPRCPLCACLSEYGHLSENKTKLEGNSLEEQRLQRCAIADKNREVSVNLDQGT